MALEPITRQEQIIAGKDLEPITRMEKFLKQYGGGGGCFEYDFIIRTDELENFTLEKGTYASIMEKLGTQPVNGRVLNNIDGGALKTDINSVVVEYVNNKLSVYAFSAPDAVLFEYVINPDNTVTAV